MADTAHSTPVSRRSTLLMIASAASLVAIPVVASLTVSRFDPRTYVKMWRDAGGVVHLASARGGRTTVGLHFPDGFEWPPAEQLELYKTGKHHDPSWEQAVIDYLRAEQGLA